MSSASRRILLATRNGGKLQEVRDLLSDLPVEIVSLADFPDAPDVAEDGFTFRDNALQKARVFARWSGRMALADDSGLEVDGLGGRPGVWSARYAGEGANDDANNRKLLGELVGVPTERRTARFRCVLALVHPDGREWVVEGSCEGRIASEPRGKQGFGYDPLFLVTELDKTFAELGPQIKNRTSHRAKALQEMRAIMQGILGRRNRSNLRAEVRRGGSRPARA